MEVPMRRTRSKLYEPYLQDLKLIRSEAEPRKALKDERLLGAKVDWVVVTEEMKYALTWKRARSSVDGFAVVQGVQSGP
jgi:hypothetical protein